MEDHYLLRKSLDKNRIIKSDIACQGVVIPSKRKSIRRRWNIFLLSLFFFCSFSQTSFSQTLSHWEYKGQGIDEYGPYAEFVVPVYYAKKTFWSGSTWNWSRGTELYVENHPTIKAGGWDQGTPTYPVVSVSTVADNVGRHSRIRVDHSDFPNWSNNWVYKRNGTLNPGSDFLNLSDGDHARVRVRWYIPQQDYTWNRFDRNLNFSSNYQGFFASATIANPVTTIKSSNIELDPANPGKYIITIELNNPPGGITPSYRHERGAINGDVFDASISLFKIRADIASTVAKRYYVKTSYIYKENNTISRDNELNVNKIMKLPKNIKIESTSTEITIKWSIDNDGDDLFNSGKFVVEASKKEDFTGATEIGSVNFNNGIKNYSITDPNITNYNKGDNIYYRVKRHVDGKTDNWSWKVCIKGSLLFNSDLPVFGNESKKTPQIAVNPEYNNPYIKLQWDIKGGMWPTNTSLVITRRNLTTGGKPIEIKLEEDDARKGYYEDEDIMYCNQYAYTAQIVSPKGSGYGESQLLKYDYALPMEISEISDLRASKGYNPNNVKLQWKSHGNFDKFIIKRIEYHNPTDTVLIHTLSNVSQGSYSYEDTGGSPGIYYIYTVEGAIICNKQEVLSNRIEDVGFRSPTGNVYGRITYKGGQSVPEVEVKATSSDTDLEFSRSMFFPYDGNAYLETDKDIAFSSGNFTLQAWVAPLDASPTSQTIINKQGEYNLEFDAQSNITFTVGSKTIKAKYEKPENYSFSHITAVSSDTLLFLYINGKLAAEPVDNKGNTLKGTSSKFLMGKNSNNQNYYKGYLDEVRIWNTALDSTVIKRDYTRLLIGSESGLVAYWRFDDGIVGKFYDISCKGETYNENHGIAYGASYINVTPGEEQLTLKGLTDNDGSYSISGIPYTRGGTYYNIIPVYGTHQFEPVMANRLISSQSPSFVCDYTDNSSFNVSGTIYYSNTTVPVEGVSFLIDGLPAAINNKMITTKSDGTFTINVPVGVHEVEATKQDHTFEKGGRFLNIHGESFDYQDHMTGIEIYDSTRVKVIGRVAGGAVQSEYPLGHSLSENNLSDSLKIVLSLQGNSNSKLTMTGLKSDTIKHFLPGNKQAEKPYTTRVAFEEDKITIYPNSTTGEFVAMLIPESFVIDAVEAKGHTRVVENNPKMIMNLKSKFLEEKSCREYTDSISKDGGKTYIKTTYYDTVRYNASYKFIQRNAPEIKIVQTVKNKPLEYFGDKETVLNRLDGKLDTIPLIDDNKNYLWKVPVFRQGKEYTLQASVFEKYTKYKMNGDNPEVERTNEVAVVDGTLHLTNNIGTVVQDSISINENGIGEYTFTAGDPEMIAGNKQKALKIELKTSDSNVPIPWIVNETEGISAYVIGATQLNSPFVTTGPNLITAVLRDPPGSNSYSYLEEGTTIERESTYVGGLSLEQEVGNTGKLGGKIVFLTGMGMAIQTDTKISTENKLLGVAQESIKGESGTITTVVSSNRWETSADPLYVGANGDLYIGNSTNVLIGKTNSLDFVKDEDLEGNEEKITSVIIGEETLWLVKREALAMGLQYETAFAYPQIHIEETLIPNLEKLRDNLLTDLSKDQAEAKADAENAQVYYRTSDEKGYAIAYPENWDNHTDSVLILNQSVKDWKKAIEANEKIKVEALNKATKKQNHSFHAGSKIEESRSYSTLTHNQQEFEFVIGSKLEMVTEVSINEIGYKGHLNINSFTNHGGRFHQDHTNTTTMGFVLAEDGDDDYISVDVMRVPRTVMVNIEGELINLTIDNWSDDESSQDYLFVTRGGATSCPYEGGYRTKYYQPGTPVDMPTAQIEVPALYIRTGDNAPGSSATITNVPENRKAVFKLDLINKSEINEDVWFDLALVDDSNPNGASLHIDGGALGSGRSFMVPFGENGVVKTLEVGKGIGTDFENIKLVLRSRCQSDPTAFLDVIADTVTLNAYFVPACTDVNIKSPADKWVINSSTGSKMLIEVDNFDLQTPYLKKIILQYKPSNAPDDAWLGIRHFYISADAMNADESVDASQKEVIEGSPLTFEFDMSNATMYPDQNYDICAVSVCAVPGKGDILSVSNIATGIKDTYNPRLFGSPQPANGILGVNDEVKLTFNEKIDPTSITNKGIMVKGTRNGSPLNNKSSVSFNGQSGYLASEANRNLAGKAFSVEMTLKSDEKKESFVFAHGDINESFEFGFNAEGYLHIFMNGTKIASAEASRSKGLLNANDWNKLAVIYDPVSFSQPRVTAYLNGTQIINIEAPSYNGSGNVVVGTGIKDADKYFAGKIHELRIWNDALTLPQIKANENVTLKGTEPGLLAYYPMSGGKGDVILDKARGANMKMTANWFVDTKGLAAKFSAPSFIKLDASTFEVSKEKDYTVEFWFKAGAGQKNTALVSSTGIDNKAPSETSNKLFIGFNENGKLTLKNSGYSNVIDKNYLDDNWHHYALSVNRTANKAYIYLDDILQAYFEADKIDGILGNVCLGARMWIEEDALDEDKTDMHYSGLMDEFRLWNLSKNESLLKQENNIRLEGTEIGLLLYCPFETYVASSGIEQTKIDYNNQAEKTAGTRDTNSGMNESENIAPVIDSDSRSNIDVEVIVNNDALIINPKSANGWNDYEQTIVSFTVNDIKDMNGNTTNSDIQWSAFINRNQLRWSEDALDITQDAYKSKEFTVNINNLGGSVERYSILNAPAWLVVQPSSGSINPNSSQKVTFKIDEGLNIGTYDEAVYLVNENNLSSTLNLNIKVKGEKPDWTVNPQDYKYNMSIYGKLRINNIFSNDKEDMIAAFINGKCVGVANSQYLEKVDMWYAFLTVYSNEKQVDNIEFRIWDESTGRILLAQPDRQITFTNDVIVGTPDIPVVFDGKELMFQNYSLNNGWNWISFNLANQSLSNVNATLANAIWQSGDEVKHNDYVDSYSAKNGWVGTLSSVAGGFNNTSMYMLRTSQAQTLSVAGSKINTKQMPLDVNPQWNYISYLPATNMTVLEALTDYDAVNGDIVKSQSGFAMYSDNLGWIGNLTYMEPGKGYMLYRSPQAGKTSFTYPSGSGLLKSAVEELYDLYENNNFAENMSVIAIPSADFDVRPTDIINAYADGELRGVGNVVFESNAGQPVSFINIAGQQKTPVYFTLERDGQIIGKSNKIFNYLPNSIQGSIDEPFVIDFSKKEGKISILPTIFEREVEIIISNSSANNVDISVYDLNGRMMYSETNKPVINGYYRTTWNGSWVSKGTYLITIVIDGEISTHKVIKK